MFLYEYYCKTCNLRFETRRRMAERHTAECPQCGQPAKKIISPINFTFGWTVNNDITPFKKDEFVRNM